MWKLPQAEKVELINITKESAFHVSISPTKIKKKKKIEDDEEKISNFCHDKKNNV